MRHLKEFSDKLCTENWLWQTSFGKMNYVKTVSFKETKLTLKEFKKLFKTIKDNDLVIIPYSHLGFRPAYNIYEVECNPMFGYEKKHELTFHSNQFPKNIEHEDFEKYFLSKRNLELAELIEEPINIEADYYY